MLKFKNRKGSGLTMAISIAFFSIVMMAIVSLLLSTNAVAARRQREVTQAYYLTLAGIEIGTSVVLKRGLDDSSPILDHFKYHNFTGNFEDEEFFEYVIFGPNAPSGHPDLPDFNGSEIEIKIYATYQDGTRITGSTPTSGHMVWVEVFSLGRFYNASEWQQIQSDPTLRGQIGTAHAGRIRFNTIEPEWQIREIANPNDF